MANPFTVRIKAREKADVAFYLNVAGKLDIAIRTRDGSDKLPAAWWITWGVGSACQLGEKKTDFETQIPVKWWKGIVSAKLRAQAGESDTVLTVWENSELDGSISFEW